MKHARRWLSLALDRWSDRFEDWADAVDPDVGLEPGEYDELVIAAIKANPEKLADNVTVHNALLHRLKAKV